VLLSAASGDQCRPRPVGADLRSEDAKEFTVEDFRRHAAAMKPETRMLIDGELVDSPSGKHFETVNPALAFQYFAETIDKIGGTATATATDAFHYICTSRSVSWPA
jgi:hypothetical protein